MWKCVFSQVVDKGCLADRKLQWVYVGFFTIQFKPQLFIYLLEAYSPVNRTGSPQGFFLKPQRQKRNNSNSFTVILWRNRTVLVFVCVSFLLIRWCLLSGVYVPRINRMPGGVIIAGDSGLSVVCLLDVWRGGSVGRASDSRSKDRRFEPRLRQEHKNNLWEFFRVKNVVLTRCPCA